MPYTVQNPPEAIKGLPEHAIAIFVAAFNAAFAEYNGEEGRAMATAWTAVKGKYEKNADGEWVAKEATMTTKKKAQDRPTEAELKAKLTQVYDMIVKEAAARLMPEDTARIQSIMAMCQELLGEDIIPDQPMQPEIENKFAVAQSEAEKVLGILQDREIGKTEDGEMYPASAFAYVPDATVPSGWKLRLWEDATKKVTRTQLGKVAATLSPGGYRGIKADIPASEVAPVKLTVRSAYKALGIADEEIPKWVKESEQRAILHDFVPLTEAAVKDGKARIVVIKAGFNVSKERFYPAEVLRRDFKIFEGVKMYADHPTAQEDKERPERSIRDFVAILSDVSVDEAGTVSGIATIVEPWMLQKLANLQDKGMLNQMGVSINAVASASKADVQGVKTMLVERLIAARSVDFVTEAGAGGTVLALEADSRNDIDLIDLDSLKGRRPDLVQALETEAKIEATKEAKKLMEQIEELKQVKEANTVLANENTKLKADAEAAATAKTQAEVKAAVESAVAASTLPDAAKKRILISFASAVKSDGIAEAIKAEGEYIATLTETAKVKNMGNVIETPKGKDVLRESFKRANPKWTDAQLDIAVNGR